MANRLYVVLAIVILGLTSCSLIDHKTSPAIDVYTLSPMLETKPEKKANNAVVLALSPIRSARSLMSSGIIYRESQYSYDAYAYSRWSDSPAKLLEVVIQQYLSYSQCLSAVTPSETISDADVLLEGTLIDFSHHIDNDDTSTGQVVIRFYLIDVRTKAVLATKEFSAEVIAESTNAQGASTAINQASKKVVEELNDWIEEHTSQKTKQ